MFIYNVTIKVAHTIHTDWFHWMKNEHIPAVMASGCFSHFQFVRLLETDEEDGVNLCCAVPCAKPRPITTAYIEQFAPELHAQ
jgi:hypothetical protein